MRQSQLDDIPGIGPAKKAGLLRHFGSLRDLAKATEAEIAAAPGIGPKLAGIIKASLS
jgi:excinuclease ABC subunit C